MSNLKIQITNQVQSQKVATKYDLQVMSFSHLDLVWHLDFRIMPFNYLLYFIKNFNRRWI